MRTLGNITARANNGKLRKREPSWKKMPPTLDSPQDENEFDTQSPAPKHNNTPHFMSSTMASNSQAANPVAKATSRTLTPTSIASSSSKSRDWVASAVKRVAMRKSEDTTTDAKEEKTLSRAINLTSSDKVCRRMISAVKVHDVNLDRF